MPRSHGDDTDAVNIQQANTVMVATGRIAAVWHSCRMVLAATGRHKDRISTLYIEGVLVPPQKCPFLWRIGTP